MTLKTIIDNVDNFHSDFLEGVIQEYAREDHLRTLKSEIRQTVYHAIETTFELIFALSPASGRQPDDTQLPAKLSQSNWRENYQRINDIADNDTSLDFLDKKLNIQGHSIPISRYLFYHGIMPNNKAIQKKYLDLINPSIVAIKLGLKTIAQEFIDRGEYNSYKHALRIVPSITHFWILNAETEKSIIDWDLSDSMTFIQPGEDDNEIEIVTRLFDTNRDIELVLFCSNLISNMILLRRAAFQVIKDRERVPILYFGDKEVKNLNTRGVPIQDLKYKIKKDNGS